MKLHVGCVFPHSAGAEGSQRWSGAVAVTVACGSGNMYAEMAGRKAPGVTQHDRAAERAHGRKAPCVTQHYQAAERVMGGRLQENVLQTTNDDMMLHT